MPTYLIFKEGSEKIIRRVTCPSHMAVSQLEEGEFLIEGNESDEEYKIVGLDKVLYTEEEKADNLYAQRVGTLPQLDISMDDAALNLAIDEYFTGHVDVQQLRIDNYSWLRDLFYPDFKKFYLDSQVKLSSTDPLIQTEGQSQLDQYNADCMAVKVRFPKE